ncbi:MAG: glycosyltransferase [Chlorobiaceae bacterium]|nr:glycosyltransferase [Chlorobiaceae bacterium]NTV60849.1 glycosyltransferase [Chlorobiaceae bacterium]
MQAFDNRNGIVFPDIDCVLIGVNCARTLGRCIESVFSSFYPREKLHLYYVDGGSGDNSIEIAENLEGVKVIGLDPEFPAPGLQRNHGWKAGSSSFVQFLDSDTILDPRWLQQAVDTMQDGTIGAVNGFRRELHPDRSVYNWIGDLEWNGLPGESDCFGGDVLVRRSALEKTGGYDEVLVGGEDPELSRRIIRAGWKIMRLDALMTSHDLAMTTVRQYLKRAYRSGYGFAAVRAREAKAGSPFWKYDSDKITIKAGGFFLLQVSAILLVTLGNLPVLKFAAALCSLSALGLLFSPRLFRIEKFMRAYHLEKAEAITYSWHCSLVVVPQFAGMSRFYAGRIFNMPLRNRRRTLKTALSIPHS